MKRFGDFLRLIFISPEVGALLLPFVAYTYVPEWGDVFLKPMIDSVTWGLSAAGMSIGLLVFNYSEGKDLLSPSGGKKLLIAWPGYPALKARWLAALAWCVLGAFACLIATWMVASQLAPRLAITVLTSGIVAAAVSTATVGLARFRLREILAEHGID
jgi:hypothetical protein